MSGPYVPILQGGINPGAGQDGTLRPDYVPSVEKQRQKLGSKYVSQRDEITGPLEVRLPQGKDFITTAEVAAIKQRAAQMGNHALQKAQDADLKRAERLRQALAVLKDPKADQKLKAAAQKVLDALKPASFNLEDLTDEQRQLREDRMAEGGAAQRVLQRMRRQDVR